MEIKVLQVSQLRIQRQHIVQNLLLLLYEIIIQDALLLLCLVKLEVELDLLLWGALPKGLALLDQIILVDQLLVRHVTISLSIESIHQIDGLIVIVGIGVHPSTRGL